MGVSLLPPVAIPPQAAPRPHAPAAAPKAATPASTPAPVTQASPHPLVPFAVRKLNTRVVATDGTGQYRTLAEAFRNVPDDTRVLVRPGVYRENLVLDRRVELVGDGPTVDIIIESTNATCIRLTANHGTLRGLTLRSLSRSPGTKCFGVDISGGTWLLEDCDIVSDSLACLVVRGASADPIVRRCQIHDGNGSGVFVHGNGRGKFENCDIFGNAGSGVAICNFGDPVFRHCQIHHGKEGVAVYRLGHGTIADCSIYENTESGVAIWNGGEPTIRRCQIAHNGHVGVWVYDGGAGHIEGCNLTGNTRGPWEIAAGCSVQRSNNKE